MQDSSGYPWVKDVGTPYIPVSVPVNSGDILVAVVQALTATRNSDSPTDMTWTELLELPNGWQREEGWHWTAFGSHDPNVRNGASWVAWYRAPAAATWTGTFRFRGAFDRDPSDEIWMKGRAAYVHVLRFSGMVSVRGLVGRQSSNWTFPAVPNTGTMPSNGHALRIGGMLRAGGEFPSGFGPGGHTELIKTVYGQVQMPPNADVASSMKPRTGAFGIWEQPLTSAAPAAVSAGGGYQSGFQVSIFVASAAPPSAPTINAPLDGSVDDYTQPFTISWTPALTQDSFRVTRQKVDAGGSPTGSLEYLTNVNGASWSTSATTLTSTATSVDVPAGVFTTAGGQRWRITVATTTPGSSSLGPSSAVTVRSFLPPTADSVSVPLLSGKIPDRLSWIIAEGTPGAGATLDLYDVEVVDHATGAILAAGTHGPGWWFPIPAETPLPNGSIVRLRGRVRQTGSQWSEWIENGPFEVDAPRPPAPTITGIDVGEHPVSGLPGISVTVTSAVDGDITLYRDGVAMGTWPITVGTPLVVGDFASGSGSVYTATVTALVDNGSPPTPLPSESLPSAPVTSTLDMSLSHCWLIDPLNPADAVRAHCQDLTETHEHPTTVYYPLSAQGQGPAQPIVQSLTPHAPSGTLTVWTDTHAQEAAVIRMFTSGRPLVYTRWSEYTPGHPRTVGVLPPLWFIPVGPVTPTRVGGQLQARTVSVGWVATR